VSFKPSCYKTTKTPNNVCNAMVPNSVITFFVITTLLEALRKESISQVQVENTRSYFLPAILTLFNNFFYLSASTLVNTDTVRPGGGEKTFRSSRLLPTRSSRLGGGRRDDRSVFPPPPGLTVSVLTSVLALT